MCIQLRDEFLRIIELGTDALSSPQSQLVTVWTLEFTGHAYIHEVELSMDAVLVSILN